MLLSLSCSQWLVDHCLSWLVRVDFSFLLYPVGVALYTCYDSNSQDLWSVVGMHLFDRLLQCVIEVFSCLCGTDPFLSLLHLSIPQIGTRQSLTRVPTLEDMEQDICWI